MKRQARGSHDTRFHTSREVLLIRWNDNAIVTVGTNFDSVTPLGVAQRRGRGVRNTVAQPKVIAKYNSSMGGVDLFDGHVATYRIAFRSKKWYWPLIIHGIDAAVSNSWVMFRSSSTRARDQLDFRRSIVTTYLMRAAANNIAQAIPARIPANVRYDKVNHFVASRLNQRRCKLPGCTSRPRTYCIKCDKTLCVDCFLPYHTTNFFKTQVYIINTMTRTHFYF